MSESKYDYWNRQTLRDKPAQILSDWRESLELMEHKDDKIQSLESLLREAVKVQVEATKAIGRAGLQGYYHKRQEKIDKLLEFKDKPEIKAILGEGK